MPDVLVRDVDSKVLEKLKQQAKKNGRSLQNELLGIFVKLTEGERSSDAETAKRIRRSFGDRIVSNSADLLREDRNR